MRPSLHLKINIALVVSLAFIFRLLFTDSCLFSSTDHVSAGKHISAHCPKATKKRRRDNEVLVKPSFEKYTSLEVYEENPDNEEDLIKADSPVLLSFLYSSLFKKTASALVAGNEFDPVKYNLPGKKYLALSILRI